MECIATTRNRYQHDPNYQILFNLGNVLSLDKGQYICHEGDEIDCVYFLALGTVYTTMSTGSVSGEVIISRYDHGQFLGEKAFLCNNQNRIMNMKAKTEIEVVEIPLSKFKLLLKAQPHFYHQLMTQLAARLDHTEQFTYNLISLSTEERLMNKLIELTTFEDAVTHPDGHLLKYTRMELAKMMGISRETVGRVLKNLCEKNMIKARGKSIVVHGTR